MLVAHSNCPSCNYQFTSDYILRVGSSGPWRGAQQLNCPSCTKPLTAILSAVPQWVLEESRYHIQKGSNLTPANKVFDFFPSLWGEKICPNCKWIRNGSVFFIDLLTSTEICRCWKCHHEWDMRLTDKGRERIEEIISLAFKKAEIEAQLSALNKRIEQVTGDAAITPPTEGDAT